MASSFPAPPPKENPNMEKALFDWPVVLQYDVKANYLLISRQLSGMTFFRPSVRLTNQKPSTFLSGRQTTQIALFPFVCCFCFVRAFSFQGHTKREKCEKSFACGLLRLSGGLGRCHYFHWL